MCKLLLSIYSLSIKQDVYFLFCSKTETELQELIKEVEDNPAPEDAPQPPSPGDSGNG